MNPIRQLSRLTEREREVLKLFCEGLPYKDIAEELVIAESTVKTHMRNIVHKLELQKHPPRKRRMLLAEKFCPLLKKVELPPYERGTGDEPDSEITDPEKIDKIVEEDERALVVWEPKPPVPIDSPVEPPPPQPRRSRWLLVGVILGIGLILVIYYGLGGALFTEQPPQGTQVPMIQYRNVTRVVTVEVTSTPARSQPTPQHTFTAAPVILTETSTNTPAPPTLTLTPTVPEDTSPDTVLEVGEWWKKDGFELMLSEMKYGVMGKYDVQPVFVFRNNTTSLMSFEVDSFDITIIDSNGNAYHQEGNCKYQFDLSPGDSESESFRCPGGENFPINYYDSSVQYLDVIVRNFGRIDIAKWRVPIFH